MGQLNRDQEQLFYSFRLDEVVPDDHLVRAIAAVLDLSWVHAELASYYPKIGRPSIDPVLMIRVIFVARRRLGGPTITISSSISGSDSISGAATKPPVTPISARWERTALMTCADVASSKCTATLMAHLRKAAERTIPRLSRRIGAIVTAFSLQECTNYFRHAGYAST